MAKKTHNFDGSSPRTIEARGRTYDLSTVAARIATNLRTEAERVKGDAQQSGRHWAAERAAHWELIELALLRDEDVCLHDLLSDDFESIGDMIELDAARVISNSATLSLAFGSGFVGGAMEVWDAVKSEVEVEA